MLQETGALKTVQFGWKFGATATTKQACRELLQYWEDVLDLGKVAMVASNGTNGHPKQFESPERAGRGLTGQRSGGFPESNTLTTQLGKESSKISVLWLLDLIPSRGLAAHVIFQKLGLLVIERFLGKNAIVGCKVAASECLEVLIEEQLAI
jgi:hypothetical protein